MKKCKERKTRRLQGFLARHMEKVAFELPG